MATGAAAIPVPGPPLPQVIIPELLDQQALAAVMNTPGGTAAAFHDVYGHIRQLYRAISTGYTTSTDI